MISLKKVNQNGRIKMTLTLYFLRKSKYNCRDTDAFSNIVELLLLQYYTSINEYTQRQVSRNEALWTLCMPPEVDGISQKYTTLIYYS